MKSSHKLGTKACAFQGKDLLQGFSRGRPQRPSRSPKPAWEPHLGFGRVRQPRIWGWRGEAQLWWASGWVRDRECPPSLGSRMTQDSLVDPLGGQGRPQPGRNNHGALPTSELFFCFAPEAGQAGNTQIGSGGSRVGGQE